MKTWRAPPDRLNPDHRWLANAHVLTQAWRKVLGYVRWHNWHDDPLSLDDAVLSFGDQVEAWANHGRIAELEPAPVRLVPCPKSQRWTFAPTWSPVDTTVAARPLTRVEIRDQVFSTAALMCLADEVESVQGDCRLSTGQAVRRGVVSYGNRLRCEWSGSRAHFRWGRSDYYERDYYRAYEAFLARPRDVCQQHMQTTDGRDTLIVHLDARNFYGSIGCTALVDSLKSRFEDKGTPRFWQCLRRMLCFAYHEEDARLFEDTFGYEPRLGIPQGLAAGGFFANAYMLAFDAALRRWVHQVASSGGVRVLDGCRFVDDLRISLACSPEVSSDRVLEHVVDEVQQLLSRHAPGIELNREKSFVERLGSSPAGVPVAGSIRDINRRLSGPLDIEGSLEVLTELQGLIALVANVRSSPDTKPANMPESLARVLSRHTDVREDTVERFAAGRWRAVFRDLRAQSDDHTRALLDEQALALSRRLLSRWVDDPSQVRLLLVSLSISPHPDHADAAVSLLEELLRRSDPAQRSVGYFIVGRLLYAAAEGMVDIPDSDGAPIPSDGFLDRLDDLARSTLRSESPWYAVHSAILYLASRRESLPRATRFRDVDGAAKYVAFHRLVCSPGSPALAEVRPAMFLLCMNMGLDPQLVARAFLRWSRELPGEDRLSATCALLPEDDLLADEIVRLASQYAAEWVSEATRLLGCQTAWAAEGSRSTLARLLRSDDNPFRHENAALHLLLKVTEAWSAMPRRKRPSALTPDDVTVAILDPERLLDPIADESVLDVQLRVRRRYVTLGPYQSARWLRARDRWRFALGRIVRAGVVGTFDPTAWRTVVGPGGGASYRPLKTSWWLRLFGTFTGRAALGGADAPVSDRDGIGPLIHDLLRWPGSRSSQVELDTGESAGLAAVRRAARDQLATASNHFARATGIPMYATPVRLGLSDEQVLRVAMVQTVLPRVNDLKRDPEAIDRKLRGRLSRHLRSATALVYQAIRSRGTFDRSARGARCSAHVVVYPELAVHLSDIGILQRLARATGALVLCGLVFHRRSTLPGAPLVNRACWILPDGTPIYQGKAHPMKLEKALSIAPARDHQRLLSIFDSNSRKTFNLTASICYDATDLAIASDLKGLTDAWFVPALNRDVPTFDNMVAALHYHMFQHVVLVNTGQYGGSVTQAPFKDSHRKTIAAVHGMDQLTVTFADLRLGAFDGEVDHLNLDGAAGAVKYPPAGWKGRQRLGP